MSVRLVMLSRRTVEGDPPTVELAPNERIISAEWIGWHQCRGNSYSCVIETISKPPGPPVWCKYHTRYDCWCEGRNGT